MCGDRGIWREEGEIAERIYEGRTMGNDLMVGNENDWRTRTNGWRMKRVNSAAGCKGRDLDGDGIATNEDRQMKSMV